VTSLKDIASVPATADPARKAQIYADVFGIRITYDPTTRMVAPELRPEGVCRTERVGGGKVTMPFAHLLPPRRGDLRMSERESMAIRSAKSGLPSFGYRRPN
jgi:hypothetical protein